MGLRLIAKKSGKQLDLTQLQQQGGKYVEVAVPGEEYQLIDTETGKTPEGLKVARQGDDLIIKSVDDKYEVVIDDFWLNCDENDNQLCYAVFDVPATETAEAGQVIVTQVGEDVSAFNAGTIGTLLDNPGFPLWAYIAGGALAVGAIAAAAGGGSDSHTPADTTPPKQPEITVSNNGTTITVKTDPNTAVTVTVDTNSDGIPDTTMTGVTDGNGNFSTTLDEPLKNKDTVIATATNNSGNKSTGEFTVEDVTSPDAPTNLDVNGTGTEVTGKAEPGSTITITDPKGNVIGTGIVKSDGSFTVPLNPAQKDGEELSVVATDDAGNTSEPASVIADDTTPAAAPDAAVNGDGTQVSGTGEPGSTITVKNPKGETVGTGTVNPDGSFTVPLNPAQNDGQKLTVTATDAGGKSPETTVQAPDTTPAETPDHLQVNLIGTQVSGTGEPGSTITVKDPAGNTIGTGTVNSDGSFTVPLNPAQTDGQQLQVTAEDKGGKSAPAPVAAPAIPPDAPQNVTVNDDGTQVSGTAQPGSTITVTDPNNPNNVLGTGTVNPDGSFTVDLNPAQTDGQILPVIATDNDGNSEPTAVKAPDTAPPTQPNATVNDAGNSVSGTGEPGSTITVKDPAGNVIGTGTVNSDGSFTVPLDSPQTDGQELTVTATDDGGESSPATATAPDTTPAAAPTDVKVNGDGTQVSGTGEPGSTITVTDPNNPNTVLGTGTVNPDGSFTVDLNPAQTDGQILTVTATDAGGESSPATPVAAPDTTSAATPHDVKVSGDGTQLSGQGEPGSTVTVKDPAGNTIGTGTVNPDGSFTVPLNPAQTDSQELTVTATDAGGESAPTNVTAPDVTAPSEPKLSDDNGAVKVELPSDAKPGDTVEVKYTDEGGNPQTVTLTKGEGGWTSDKPGLIPSTTADNPNTTTIPATSVKDGSEVTAVAKDPAGNENPADPLTAGNNPDTTEPSAPNLTPKADGTMDVGLPTDANPGDQVKVTVTPDGATEPTEVTLTKQPDGTWTSNNTNIVPSTTAENPNTTTIPENQVKDGSPVTAVATDEAGNSSAPTTKNATDTRTPVVDLNGQSDDNILNATEGKNITGTVKYSDGDIAEGAKVTLVNTVTHAETGPMVADKDGNFTFANVEDGTYSIKVASASGTPGTGVDKVVVDHTVPGDTSSPLDGTSDQAPSVAFVDDKNPSDGVLTRNEVGSDGKVKVEVTLPTANVNEGDTVVLTINGDTDNPVTHTITAAEAQSHKATIEVPVGTIGATEKQDLTVSAKVVDAAGQSSKEGSNSIPVDRTVNGTPSIEYVEDTGSTVNDTLVGKEDGILWASENATDGKTGETTVKVNLPKGIGGEGSTDTVKITINDKIYTLSSDGEHVGENGAATYSIVRPAATSSDDPYVEIPVATTAISQIDAKVEVTYTKAGENTPTTVGTEDVILTIDSAVPGGDADNNNIGDTAPTLTIAEATDGVNADDLSDGKVVATVTLPDGVQAGDHIILKDANGNVLADVPVGDTTAAGTEVQVDIPKSKLPDGNYTVTATVKEDGANGRESAPSSAVSFTVDTDAPNAPDLTENNGGVDITLPADAQPNDTVKVEYTKEDGTQGTVTLTKQQDGTWTSSDTTVIPNTTTTSPNAATLPANQVKDGTQVNATASDNINPDVSAAPVTVNDTRTPVIALTGDSADNQLAKTDGNTITGTVKYSDGDTAEGATVTLVNTATNAETGPVPVGADGTFTFENVADGVYTVKATNGDKNATPQTVTVDHTGPANADITFTTDSGVSNTDKISNDGHLTIDPKDGSIVDGSVEYSKDGGTTWTPLAKDAGGNYVLPEDGTYSVRVTTVDAYGNPTTTKVDGFVVDKTPLTAPSLTTTGIDGDGSVTVGLPTDAKVGDKVEVSVTPEGATQPVTVTLTKGENGWTSNKPAIIADTTSDTAIIPENAVEDGSTVTAKSVDTAGNEAEATPTATAGSDALAANPTVTVAEAADGYVNKAELDDGGLTGTTTDAPNGSTVQLLKEDGTEVAKTTVTDNAFSFAKENVPDGKYTIKVTTPEADGAKEVSTSAFTVNTAVPQITGHRFITDDPAGVNDANNDGTITHNELNNQTTVKYEVSFSGAVEGTKLLVAAYSIDGSATTGSSNVSVTLTAAQAADGEVTVEIPITATPDSTEKVGDIRVTRIALQDPARNSDSVIDTTDNVVDSLHIDMTPPSITMGTEVANGVNATELSDGISGTVNNVPAGTQKVQLYKDGVAVEGATADVNPTTGAFTIPNTSNVITDGTGYTVKLVGQEDTVVSNPFVIDQTAPEASVTAKTDGSVEVTLPASPENGDTVTITYTPTGADQTTATLTYNGTAWTSPDTNIEVSADKTKATIPADKVADNTTVTAAASDAVGNTQSPADTAMTAADPVTAVTVKDLTENGVVLNGSTGTNNTIDFVQAADLDGVVSVQGPAGTTSTVTFTSDKGQVTKTVSNDGTEKAINLTPEDVKTLTGGTAQAIDVTVATDGLADQNYSDVFTINPTSGVFELIPSINNVSTNDSVHPEVDAVLNGTEVALITVSSNTGPSSGISLNYTVIAPSNAQVGDTIQVYNNGGTLVPVTLSDKNLASWKAGKSLAYSVTLDSSTLSTGQEITLKAIYTPKDGQPQPLEHKYWYDGVAPTVSVEATDTTATVTLPTVSDAASVTINVGEDTVTLVKDGSNWVPQAGNTITPTIENGKAVFSDLATGTTVTATATDTVGNTSAEVSAVTQIIPMSISAASVTDENTGANGVQVVDNDVNFSYTLAGNLEADKEIRVRVVDANGNTVGEPQYFTPAAGTTTGSIAVPAINGQDLKVVTDIVSKADHNTVVGGSAKEAAFNLDNVHTVNVTSAGNDSVTVDGQTFTFGAAANSAGTTNNSQVSSDDRTRVYNPKLDWEMRGDDDTDDTSTGEYAPYHNDHADGWSYNGNLNYSWNGDDSRGDVITVAAVQTDEYYRRVLVEDPYTQTYRKGMIGGEEGQNAQFTLDTKGGGADYIQSEGIVGNVRISTNDGDDIISTKYLNGKYWASKGNFDGSEQIFMGDGNDTFKVTGTAASVGYNDVNDSSLYYTNAKVDMGSGDDTVNIAGRIFAGNQTESGNYFNLGAGNDTMTTGEISGENANWEGSTIINLGTGSDELTVNGNITSESDQTARFLLLSDDASKVTVNGSVYGKASMLMGDGADTITITGDVNIKTPAISTGGTQGSIWWVQDVFSNQYKGGLYTGFYDGISGDGGTTVNGKLADSATVAVDDSSHQMLASYITGSTDYRSLNQARFSLGDGDNHLEIQGNTTGANIVGGDNRDVVRLGDFVNYDTSVSNTYVWTGAGDDQVLLINPKGDQWNQVHVYGGKGNDDIQLYGVKEGTYTEIHAGADNDTISLWGEIRSDNTNIIDGGAGHDKVIIGNNGDSTTDKFVVGGQDSGHTQIWSMEEILFNSVDIGDQVKVYAAKLNDEHKLYIKGMSESTLANQNKVDLEGAWSNQGTATEGGVTYQHYTTTVDNTTEHLYIQNGIQVI